MRQLIESIRSIVAAGPVDVWAIKRLESCVKESLNALRATSLCQAAIEPGRYLCYKDPDLHFVVMLLVWKPGDATLIHDHGTWGVEAVLKNSLKVTQFSCCEESPEELSSFVISEGMVMHNLPPERDVHRVAHHQGGCAVSLHIYGREMTGNRSFYPGEGFKVCKLDLRPLATEFDLSDLPPIKRYASGQ